jgi:hypothetical protein
MHEDMSVRFTLQRYPFNNHLEQSSQFNRGHGSWEVAGPEMAERSQRERLIAELQAWSG